MAQHGRSSVGLSGFAIGDCARYVADWLRGKAPPSPLGLRPVKSALRKGAHDVTTLEPKVEGWAAWWTPRSLNPAS